MSPDQTPAHGLAASLIINFAAFAEALMPVLSGFAATEYKAGSSSTLAKTVQDQSCPTVSKSIVV